MVKLQILKMISLGEGAGPGGPVRNWQVTFELDGSGVSTVIDVSAESPLADVGGSQAQTNALRSLRAFLRGASQSADNLQLH